jgi:hypothetical protein
MCPGRGTDVWAGTGAGALLDRLDGLGTMLIHSVLESATCPHPCMLTYPSLREGGRNPALRRRRIGKGT